MELRTIVFDGVKIATPSLFIAPVNPENICKLLQHITSVFMTISHYIINIVTTAPGGGSFITH